MKTAPVRRAILLLGGAILLSACTAQAARPTTAPPPTPAMSPGMIMPDGTVMGAPATQSAGTPAAATKMVCAAEVQGDIAKILALGTTPTPTSTWANHLFTCTYRLPMGNLVISVREAPDAATTTAYFNQQRKNLGNAADVAGLTPAAYGTPTGTVALIKDTNVLTVDATGLPAQFGPQHQKRADLAYEVASVILGCWTGDD